MALPVLYTAATNPAVRQAVVHVGRKYGPQFVSKYAPFLRSPYIPPLGIMTGGLSMTGMDGNTQDEMTALQQAQAGVPATEPAQSPSPVPYPGQPNAPVQDTTGPVLMQPNTPNVANTRTAANVPSLGIAGPLTQAGMDTAAGVTQRPALSANGQPNYVMQQQPVLSIGGQNVTQPFNDAATTGPVLTPAQEELIDQQEERVTGDRRSQTPTGRMNPGHGYQKIPLHEKLIRMGAAMQGSSHLGGNAAMAAMGQEYGVMAGEDRAGLAAFQEAQMKYAADARETQQEMTQLLSGYDSQIARMDQLYADIEGYGDDLTGPKDGTFDAWMNTLTGDPKAYTRLQMEQMKVDQILINIAQTKGAISDKEMAIFAKPMPSMLADEAIWKAWIKEKRDAVATVRYNLANGIVVSSPMSTAATSSAPATTTLSPSDQALVNKYTS